MSAGVSISVSVTGFTPLPEAKIDDEVIAKWIEERLNDARNLFIRASSASRGGRTYRRGRRSTHTASAPGAYPAVDSGRLVGSTDFEMRGPREGVLGSDVEYAVYLTFGTTKMASRKMYADALEEVMSGRPALDELAKAVTLTTVGHI